MTRSNIYKALNSGLAQWHAQDPFAAHEEWEQAWRQLDGEEKTLAQALVQLAAARTKRQRNEPEGTKKLTLKALTRIQSLTPTGRLGFDIPLLCDAVQTLNPPFDDVIFQRVLPERVYESGILYLHGFASSPLSSKAQHIGHALRQEGWQVRIPDQNEDSFEHLTLSRALRLARRHIFDRTLVVGSSMGGYLATRLKTEAPERIVALVLMAPAFNIAERLLNKYAPSIDEWRQKGRIFVEHYGFKSQQAIRYDFIQDAQTHPGMLPIPGPAYVLAGAKDEVVPLDVIETAVRLSKSDVILDVVDDDHSLSASVGKAQQAAQAFARQLLR